MSVESCTGSKMHTGNFSMESCVDGKMHTGTLAWKVAQKEK